MIVYVLACGEGHRFDAWFRDSEAFETQRQDGALNCPICGDGAIRKAPMAPHVARAGRVPEPVGEAPAEGEAFARVLAQMRQHIEETCEDVGAGFAEEARRIHYGEADERGIYGEASPLDAAEMRAEGIAVQAIPWFVRRDG